MVNVIFVAASTTGIDWRIGVALVLCVFTVVTHHASPFCDAVENQLEVFTMQSLLFFLLVDSAFEQASCTDDAQPTASDVCVVYGAVYAVVAVATGAYLLRVMWREKGLPKLKEAYDSSKSIRNKLMKLSNARTQRGRSAAVATKSSDSFELETVTNTGLGPLGALEAGRASSDMDEDPIVRGLHALA